MGLLELSLARTLAKAAATYVLLLCAITVQTT